MRIQPIAYTGIKNKYRSVKILFRANETQLEDNSKKNTPKKNLLERIMEFIFAPQYRKSERVYEEIVRKSEEAVRLKNSGSLVPKEPIKNEEAILFSKYTTRRESPDEPEKYETIYVAEDYAKKPSDLQYHHIISMRKNRDNQGEKGFLDGSDFTWHYCPEKKEAWTWMINPEVYRPLHAYCDFNDDEGRLFASAVSHLDMETIKNKVIHYRFFDVTKEENEEINEKTFKMLKPHIEKYKELRNTLPLKIAQMKEKFIDSNPELGLQREQIKSELFEAIKMEKYDPDIEIPNGIFIFGKTDIAIQYLINWIKNHKEIQIETLNYNPNNPDESVKNLESALKNAQSYWETTGRRTLIDISSFSSLLEKGNSKQNQNAIKIFKKLTANTSEKYHSTLLFAVYSNESEFEPSLISEQSFNIRIKPNWYGISKEEKKDLDEAIEELNWLEESKYYLEDFCTKRYIKFNTEINPDKIEEIYTIMNGGYRIKFNLPEDDIDEPWPGGGLPPGGWDPYESNI